MNTANTKAVRPLFAVAALVLALALAGCGTQAAEMQAPPAPEVSVATVVAKPVREWDEFTGRFEPVQYVEIKARVPGYLQEIGFNDGDTVPARRTSP